ncbi:hypothetical protein AB0E56_04505 [Microbacterium sp. NPDC028030]|uniref:hypothetical protein n=1 Tax=Microbacterium sp. NPDC028030 TaxID=3155124 RepID=UPI0033F9A6FD
MSEPQQPSVPPTGPVEPTGPAERQHPASPPAPPATHLPAAPQYPTAPQYPAVPHYPAVPQHSAGPEGHPPAATPAAQAYPTAYPTAYPASAPASPPAYAAPGTGFPGQVPPQTQGRAANPLGVTAFVIAVATLAVNLLSSLARPFVYGGGGAFEFMLALDNGIGILSFFAYVVALVLGLIAVRRSPSRLLTGIAIGVAGAGAVGLVFTGLTIGLYQYF